MQAGTTHVAPPKRVAPSQEIAPRARNEASPFGPSIERWFDRWFERPWATLMAPSEDRVLAPALDVAETDDAFTVTAELPGMKKEDVKVEFEDGVLSISGEKTQATEQKGATYHRMERRYGAFRRALALPTAADGEKAEAKFDNGVLEVRLPKREEARPRTVKVK
jgi:HSP20 family protein